MEERGAGRSMDPREAAQRQMLLSRGRALTERRGELVQALLRERAREPSDRQRIAQLEAEIAALDAELREVRRAWG